MKTALKSNLAFAVNTALAALPASFTATDLNTAICQISYTGIVM